MSKPTSKDRLELAAYFRVLNEREQAPPTELTNIARRGTLINRAPLAGEALGMARHALFEKNASPEQFEAVTWAYFGLLEALGSIRPPAPAKAIPEEAPEPSPAETAPAKGSLHVTGAAMDLDLRKLAQTVLKTVSIVDVIGEHLRLEHRGPSLIAICPFHKEESRVKSFHVNDGRGFFYCFGCQAGGNAVSFIQRLQGVTYTQALWRLYERALNHCTATGGRERFQRHLASEDTPPASSSTCGETLALRECSTCGALVCPEHRTRMDSLPNGCACDDGSCWLPR